MHYRLERRVQTRLTGRTTGRIDTIGVLCTVKKVTLSPCTHWRSEGVSPLILNLGTTGGDQLHASVALRQGKRSRYPAIRRLRKVVRFNKRTIIKLIELYAFGNTTALQQNSSHTDKTVFSDRNMTAKYKTPLVPRIS
jgi:hypothetical protein